MNSREIETVKMYFLIGAIQHYENSYIEFQSEILDKGYLIKQINMTVRNKIFVKCESISDVLYKIY